MKQHMYAFAFVDNNDSGRPGYQYASAYAGYPEPNQITLADIEEAKATAGVSPESVMLNCSYLGYMTAGQLNNTSR